jgi:rubrerythrin
MPPPALLSRRLFAQSTAGTLLSGVGIALLAGHAVPAAAHSSGSTAGDVRILNTALALEHEAIAAYQLGATSGLLAPAVLAVAQSFQGHHRAHRDALSATLLKLGGRPVAEQRLEDYATALKAASLKTQADVLNLALRLELGAANAYLGVIPSFKDTQLAQVAARLAADETMHYTALLNALGQSLPAGALSFGA